MHHRLAIALAPACPVGDDVQIDADIAGNDGERGRRGLPLAAIGDEALRLGRDQADQRLQRLDGRRLILAERRLGAEPARIGRREGAHIAARLQRRRGEIHGENEALVEGLPARGVERRDDFFSRKRRHAEDGRDAMPGGQRGQARDPAAGILLVGGIEALEAVRPLGVALRIAPEPGAIMDHRDRRPGREARCLDGERRRRKGHVQLR